MSITEAQFDLVNRAAAPWLTLWLLADYDNAHHYAVGTMADGTYRSGDLTGSYATDGSGMTAQCSDSSTIAVTWAKVRRWATEQSETTHAAAARLLAEGRAHQAAYPSPYPGIGRAYAWDTGGSPEQAEQDRADLAVAHARRDIEVAAWREVKRAHDVTVSEFLSSLRPVDEPDLFGGAA